MKEGILSRPVMEIERTNPSMKIRRAYGTRGILDVMSRATNANIAQSKLSPAFGVVHPKGCRRLVPADITSDKPAPTWMPFTTGVGITRVNHLSKPVTLKRKTTAEVVKPAEIVSSIVKFLEIATAAMA